MVITRIPYSAYKDQECNTAGYMEPDKTRSCLE